MSLKRPQVAAIPRYLGNIVGEDDSAVSHGGGSGVAAPPSLKRPRRLGAAATAPRPPPIGVSAAEARGKPDAVSVEGGKHLEGVARSMALTTPDSIEDSFQNAFTRLCVHLVTWDFVRDFASRDSVSAPAIAAAAARQLPLVYSTVEEYAAHWEPALVEEIKANVISNLAARPSLDSIQVDVSCASDDSLAPKSSHHRALDLTTISCKSSESDAERHPNDSAQVGGRPAPRGGGVANRWGIIICLSRLIQVKRVATI